MVLSKLETYLDEEPLAVDTQKDVMVETSLVQLLDKEDSSKTQRTLIYTNLGEVRNSTGNPIHHAQKEILVENSLSPVRES